jgi:hypothetical protein
MRPYIARRHQEADLTGEPLASTGTIATSKSRTSEQRTKDSAL